MMVAFAGERGAFGELAAIAHFGGKVRLEALPEFSDVFRGVATGRYRFGVVPIENSRAGSIRENYDYLLESNLHIVGEVLLRIRHFLIANKGTSRRQVRRVFSHPIAFAQCTKFLKRFHGLTVVPVSNTAAAVKRIRDEDLRDAAAIASEQAAVDFGMKILARNIEDTKWNTTRFLVIAKTPRFPSPAVKSVKSSIVFSTKNIPGALYHCLGVFAQHHINLYKIESRPVHGKGFQYLFYLDFAGDGRDRVLRKALGRLRNITTFYRFLGSYPADTRRDPAYLRRAGS
jgi:prephenate dehydratase